MGKEQRGRVCSHEGVSGRKLSLLNTQIWHQSWNCFAQWPISHFYLQHRSKWASATLPQVGSPSSDDGVTAAIVFSLYSLSHGAVYTIRSLQEETPQPRSFACVWQSSFFTSSWTSAALSQVPLQWQRSFHTTTWLSCALEGKRTMPTPFWPCTFSRLQGNYSPILGKFWTSGPIVGLRPTYRANQVWFKREKKMDTFKHSGILSASILLAKSCWN